MAIRVILVEDHTMVRKGLCALLTKFPHIEVIAEAKNGHEAITKTKKLLPDIVLMDISMPILNGLEATRRIKEELPDIGVIMLTMHKNAEYIIHGLQSGAESYLLKESAPEELILAIETTYRHKSYFSPLISEHVIDEYKKSGSKSFETDRYRILTNREREVLQLVVEGYTTRGISRQLFISEKTARVHRLNLMEKLNLHSIAELTIFALRKGVISLDK